VPDPTTVTQPVVWWKSQKAIGLYQSVVLMTLLWTMAGLQSGVWDWKSGLLIPILSSVVVVVRDMWSPTVVGPLAMQNKRNVGG